MTSICHATHLDVGGNLHGCEVIGDHHLACEVDKEGVVVVMRVGGDVLMRCVYRVDNEGVVVVMRVDGEGVLMMCVYRVDKEGVVVVMRCVNEGVYQID